MSGMTTRVRITDPRTANDLTPYARTQPKLFENVEPDLDLAQQAIALRSRATPRNTVSAYKIAWESFSEFCADSAALR